MGEIEGIDAGGRSVGKMMRVSKEHDRLKAGADNRARHEEEIKRED